MPNARDRSTGRRQVGWRARRWSRLGTSGSFFFFRRFFNVPEAAIFMRVKVRCSRRVTRRASAPFFAIVGVASLFAGHAALQDLGPTGPSPYEVVDGWPKPFASEGFAFGGNSGVFAESPDRIFVIQRGETRLPHPLLAGFAGFVGSIGLNALRDVEARLAELQLRRRPRREPGRNLGPVGPLVSRVG